MSSSVFISDSQEFFRSRRFFPFAASIVLLFSVLLPWFSLAIPVGISFSISGSGLDKNLSWFSMLACFFGVFACFLKEERFKDVIHLLVGLAAFAAFFIIFSSYPKIDLGIESDLKPFSLDVILELASIGFYVYLASAGVLVLSGLLGLFSSQT